MRPSVRLLRSIAMMIAIIELAGLLPRMLPSTAEVPQPTFGVLLLERRTALRFVAVLP
jgi:hypothetical protein